MVTAEEFDRLADLPVDDPAGDMTPYVDWSKARRPGREVQRVNVDFPVDLLRSIDREARRIGVTRQAFIKLRMSDTLAKAPEAARFRRHHGGQDVRRPSERRERGPCPREAQTEPAHSEDRDSRPRRRNDDRLISQLVMRGVRC